MKTLQEIDFEDSSENAALFVAATVNFIIPTAMPGDPVTMMFANASVQVTPERINAMKELLGFVDGNLVTQYLVYMKNILHWELGTSIQFYPLSVNELLGKAFGWSLSLHSLQTPVTNHPVLHGVSQWLSHSQRLTQFFDLSPHLLILSILL